LLERLAVSAIRKAKENVMRQGTYPRVKYRHSEPDDSATSSASALQAVQIALDRRDNGGDVHTSDDE
jgi:hypothetical protein